MALCWHIHFAYHQTMNVEHPDDAVSRIAAGIAEPARSRMLHSLADGRGRTSTELAVLAGVTPSTASVHLKRMTGLNLVKVYAQGKHRYYSLHGPEVAVALEALGVLAGAPGGRFAPNTPQFLRAARTCYDHIAGTLGVLLHDRFTALGWLAKANDSDHAYDLTPKGTQACEALGIDIAQARALRRRFAFACLDWSERRPHLAGALGAAVLRIALQRKWVLQELDSRALIVTRVGRREMLTRFGLAEIPS
jgi:DNA-binding transcriptional ArsR family regulator